MSVKITLALAGLVGAAAISACGPASQESLRSAPDNSSVSSATPAAPVAHATPRRVTPASTAPRPAPKPKPTTAAPKPKPKPTTAAPKPVALSTCGAPANPWGYNFCGRGSHIYSPAADVCAYFDCIASFADGVGYMVECNDGMYSMSGGRSGACSHHSGEGRAVDSGP